MIARKLGLGVPYVALFSTDETNSAASPSQSAAWAARDGDLSARAIGDEIDAKVCLAGPCTQQRYQPVKNLKRAMATDWISDFTNVRSCAYRVMMLRDGIDVVADPAVVTLNREQLVELNRLVDQWWKEVTALVEENWPAIERVAEALQERLLINEGDLDVLIADRAALDAAMAAIS